MTRSTIETSRIASQEACRQLTQSASLPSAVQRQLAEILDEYLVSVEQGLPVDIDEFVARHSEFARPLREYLDGLQLLHGVSGQFDAIASENPPKRRLGDYEIIREVGRGGMGVVYEAEQISLRRRVALKVLPFAAVLDPRQILRFENEARAAAQLHHPNIVPVHGVGSDRGVHFYAMQFIEGRSLRDAIDEVRMRSRGDTSATHLAEKRHATDGQLASTEATDAIGAFSAHTSSDSHHKHAVALARLGREAAEALHAAHECGVIHRDVKPSNLLLDQRGKLWVADFGLARNHTNGTITHSGDVLGTLQYMSPEQSQGKSALIDQRTDIYSLGVTLYELLTLQRPFEGDTHANVARQIELGQYKPVRQVSPSVPRDLECVIAKAMAVSREDRYATAQELADDLRRYVDGEPIRAKPPTVVQRGAKWATRHRGAVLAACVVLCVACICLAITTVVVTRDRAQTVRRLEENRKAFEDFGIRTAEWLKGTAGTERVRRAILTEVLTSHRKLLEQVGDSPAMRADTALTLTKIASIHQDLGDDGEALDMYRQAEALLRVLMRDDPRRFEYQSEFARCRNKIGLLLRDTGNPRSAEAAIREAIAAQERLCRNEPNRSEYAIDLARSWCNLGLVAGDADRRADARRYYGRACSILEKLAERDPGNHSITNVLASTYGNRALLLADSDLGQAISYSETAVRGRRAAAGANPKDIPCQRRLASDCSDLATLYARAGQFEQATAAFDEAASLQRQLATVERAVVAHRRDLAVTLNNLGKTRSNVNQMEEARAAFQEALRIQEELCSEFPAEVSLLSRLGAMHNNLAMVYQRQHELTSAESHFRAGITCQQKATDLAPEVADYRDYFSRNLFNYARLLRDLDKPFQAAAVTYRRTDLWPNDADQQYSIAKELTLSVQQMPRNDRRRQEWADRAWAALQKARRAGWKPASVEEIEAFSEVLGSHAMTDRRFGNGVGGRS